jgi:hypothetical protein
VLADKKDTDQDNKIEIGKRAKSNEIYVNHRKRDHYQRKGHKK